MIVYSHNLFLKINNSYLCGFTQNYQGVCQQQTRTRCRFSIPNQREFPGKDTEAPKRLSITSSRADMISQFEPYRGVLEVFYKSFPVTTEDNKISWQEIYLTPKDERAAIEEAAVADMELMDRCIEDAKKILE